ncbi:MAG: Mur ligase domain-containing protein [Planctomycetota bacterium]
MKPLSLKDLAKIIEAADAKITARTITGVSTDSRTIKAGECFFAIDGENFDGHNYLSQAFENGALCAVVSKDLPGDNLLKVADTVKALGDLARWYRGACGFKVVAITACPLLSSPPTHRTRLSSPNSAAITRVKSSIFLKSPSRISPS